VALVKGLASGYSPDDAAALAFLASYLERGKVKEREKKKGRNKKEASTVASP
jgi:hypothetical protein